MIRVTMVEFTNLNGGYELASMIWWWSIVGSVEEYNMTLIWISLCTGWLEYQDCRPLSWKGPKDGQGIFMFGCNMGVEKGEKLRKERVEGGREMPLGW